MADAGFSSSWPGTMIDGVACGLPKVNGSFISSRHALFGSSMSIKWLLDPLDPSFHSFIAIRLELHVMAGHDSSPVTQPLQQSHSNIESSAQSTSNSGMSQNEFLSSPLKLFP